MSVLKFTTLTSKFYIVHVAEYKVLKYSCFFFFFDKGWLFISNTKILKINFSNHKNRGN